VSKILFVLFALALVASPALPCVAAFGYTDTPRSELDIVLADGIKVGTAYIGVANEMDYLVTDVNYIVSKAGPVFIDIEGLIFNPNPSTFMTCPYERGTAGTAANRNLLGDYQAKLDTFFSVNAALFTGTRKVYALIINSEANNRCVENWKLNTAAAYVKNKLAALGSYKVYTTVGYGLRNTPAIGGKGPVSSNGFPVDSFGNIAQFPFNVDLIGYYPYDIFDPNNPTHPLNVNNESWTTLNNKLNLALVPGQKTAMVVKAYCDVNDPIEAAWSVTCPNQRIWVIGTAATNWATYLRSDPRNLFIIGFDWLGTGQGEYYGSKYLSPLWQFHTTVQSQVNCSVP
jgi:hypothetical protein